MNKISKIITGASLSASAIFISGVNSIALAKDPRQDLQGYVKVPDGFFFKDPGTFLNYLLTAVMMLAGLLVFAYLIWGGIEWITSGGDKGKTENARNKITAAIIGLVILAASWAIMQLVLNLLGVGGYREILAPPSK